MTHHFDSDTKRLNGELPCYEMKVASTKIDGVQLILVKRLYLIQDIITHHWEKEQ